ncbi:hypothetical protein G7Y79_00011g030420 [Physcia stellaris]|nr:hypothetical protein G7Y79_00011g030420 [Physcia stellaris]
MVSYTSVMESEEAVGEWTSLIWKRKWGFCFVDGCPVTGEATQKLIERIAFIRNTHYGGFWQFTADLSLKDAAYTSLPLAAHTDNTYFTDPAGLQTFHLLSHTNGDGGASLLVDGFRAASILRSESPDAFHDLCHIKITAHSSGNDGISITPSQPFPVLVTAEAAGRAEVIQIRWNNDDRATLPADDPELVKRFYAAARKWVQVLRRPENEYWVKLQPGRPLANMDDFVSRWKTLNFANEVVIDSV